MIKNLNDRILTQSIVIETLVQVIIDSGIISEKDLEAKLQQNVESVSDTLDTLQKESSDLSLEDMKGLYFGPVGEA